jgi:LysM repeat protein
MLDLDPVTGTGLGDIETPSPCDLCFIKALKFQAESPFYGDSLLSSIYTSKTSSCKVTGMPLTISTLPVTTTTPSSPTPKPTCAGKTYAIQSGDTCYSVSKSQQIGTGWLITDNNLNAYCADFPSSGILCLVNTCKTVTVQENETCEAIAQRNSITVPQLKAWNLVSTK